MKPRISTRSLLGAAQVLLGGLIAPALFALLVNLSWFDEPLHPDLAPLATPEPVSLEDNAYPSALAFLAADGRDPRLAGRQIVAALRERYEQGRRIALGPEEWRDILGERSPDAAWQAQFESLGCNTRTHADCADRLIAEAARADSLHPRLSVLLDRYDAILRRARFEENRERDVHTRAPPYRELMNAGRLRLALSYGLDSTPSFLTKAGADFDFWMAVLRDSDTLPAKMVSLAGLQNNLDFVSTLIRNRDLDDGELEQIRRSLRPFTSAERDIGEAFVSEARIALLSETPPMVMGSSWAIRLMLQENATLNEEYLTVFVPTRLRARLDPREFYRLERYEPLTYDLRVFPPPLFNLGGKLARRSAWPDVPEYVSRVHDQNGRISLVLLQAEIEGRPASDAEDAIESSIYRNPYTGEPMEYDAQAQTIGFECLHSVFHAPNPPDLCSVQLARAAR